MTDKIHPIGAGLAGFLLSLNTLLMLEKKAILTEDEMLLIIDQAQLALEVHQGAASPEDQGSFQFARELLEQTLQILPRRGS